LSASWSSHLVDEEGEVDQQAIGPPLGLVGLEQHIGTEKVDGFINNIVT